MRGIVKQGNLFECVTWIFFLSVIHLVNNAVCNPQDDSLQAFDLQRMKVKLRFFLRLLHFAKDMNG